MGGQSVSTGHDPHPHPQPPKTTRTSLCRAIRLQVTHSRCPAATQPIELNWTLGTMAAFSLLPPPRLPSFAGPSTVRPAVTLSLRQKKAICGMLMDIPGDGQSRVNSAVAISMVTSNFRETGSFLTGLPEIQGEASPISHFPSIKRSVCLYYYKTGQI